MSLADVHSMEADVTIPDETKAAVAGHVHARVHERGNSPHLKLSDWKSPNGKADRRNPTGTDVQELGWVFSMTSGDDRFSWHRQGDTGRITRRTTLVGSAERRLPDTMKCGHLQGHPAG